MHPRPVVRALRGVVLAAPPIGYALATVLPRVPANLVTQVLVALVPMPSPLDHSPARRPDPERPA